MIVYYPDSILASVAAIRAYYGLNSQYEADQRLEKVINEKKPQQIIMVLVDAMGANLINRKMKEDDFIKKYMLYQTSSVFPPTTTAATTSILCGNSPNKTGWLGWTQYDIGNDDIVVPFLGKSVYQDKEYESDYFKKKYANKEIIDELLEKGIMAEKVMPAFAGGYDSFTEMCNYLKTASKEKRYQFIYAYWDKYDSYMHEVGPNNKGADMMLKEINDILADLANNLAEDSLLIVVADHGQVEVENYDVYHSKFNQYLNLPLFLEGRAAMFSVVEEKKEEFLKSFKEEFEDSFIILSKEEVLLSKLFGEGDNHPLLQECPFDFLAIAKSKLTFTYEIDDKHVSRFKGHHAGMCEDELFVPVIVYPQ